jgi:hypothetical protein
LKVKRHGHPAQLMSGDGLRFYERRTRLTPAIS